MRGIVLAAVGVVLLGAGDLRAQSMQENFDERKLDGQKWSSQQIKEGQWSFLDTGRCGASAIDIKIQDGDGGLECAKDELCQRAELRNVKPLWPEFGKELWYSFSFKIVGKVEPLGSDRLVVGQWKAPGDDSPMLAQRFDNGVFHITVEDNGVRRVVASADGDPDATQAVQEDLSKIDPRDTKTVDAVTALQSIGRLVKQNPQGSGVLFSQQLRDGIDNKASSSDYQALADSLGLADPDLIAKIGNLSYVDEPAKYIGPANIRIEPEADNKLPDPSKDWVDMVYRIKPGRTDNEYGPTNEAEIDIWANGKKIVSVRGNIGGTLRKTDNPPLELIGPRFKFGIYRKSVPGVLDFQLDEYSQAPTKEGLAPACNSN